MVYGKVRVRAPATVSNLNCGFDVIGLALDEPGDIAEVELTDSGTVEIAAVTGCGSISVDPQKNVAGAVLLALLEMRETLVSSGRLPDHGISTAGSSYSGSDPGSSPDSGISPYPGSFSDPAISHGSYFYHGASPGFRVTLHKGIRPGSGIGSSGASAAAAALAASHLLGGTLSQHEMVLAAMEGERLASGAAHADNVAPSLLGGIVLVRSYEPLDLVSLHVPGELRCVVIHPYSEIKTSLARGLLDTHLLLTTAVKQWGNLAGLVAGLYREDYDLIGRSLIDRVAEPRRAALIPGFDRLKEAALAHGALGAGISGAGPSLFALCRGEEAAVRVMQGMREVMDELGVRFEGYISAVNSHGAQVI